MPDYAASKGGVGQLAKAFANEWAARNIQVNAIAPGLHRHRQYRGLAQRSEPRRIHFRAHPAGRWGRPEDFAGPAVFLASAASDYVSGTILTVGRLDGTLIPPRPPVRNCTTALFSLMFRVGGEAKAPPCPPCRVARPSKEPET
ncbi:SDR family oxidoreductase [Sinorhizobium meliloti]|uniref:SDR family oxidoreductase n=1 Tax=Rhizobium meliloti TaxID=382 RepID=UPI001F2BB9AA|nr:SDR family oxidoreductase [Sinorhizobium meliloti]